MLTVVKSKSKSKEVKALENRFKTAIGILKGEEAKCTAQKVYDNFEITNVFWDVEAEEVELIGHGFSVTIADV